VLLGRQGSEGYRVLRYRHALETHLNLALPGFSSSSVLPGATRAAIPSCVFAPLQGLLLKAPARHLSMGATSPGIPVPFSVCVPKESTYPRRSHLRVKVPRAGNLTLFAACSSLGLAGLFHPANALRLHPSGISPLKEPRQLIAAAVPSCRCSAGCAPAPRKRDLRRTNPSLLGGGAGAFGRLHGFAPLESPFPRPEVLAPVEGRAPLGFSPLQGFPLRSDAGGSSPLVPPALLLVPTLTGYPASPSTWCATEYHSPRRWRCLSRGCRPLLRFLAAQSSRFSADGSWLIDSPRSTGGVTAP